MPSERNKVLSITTKAIDKMAPALRVSIRLLRTMRTVGTRALKALRSAARAVGRAFKAMLGPLGAISTILAALSGVAIFRTLTRIAEGMDDIAKRSVLLQAPVEAVQELAHVANLAGTDINVLFKAMQRVTDAVGEAARGTGMYVDNLARLGIELDDIKDLDPVEQFTLYSEAMANLASNTERITIATDTFGQRNLAILNVMNRGSQGMAEMREEARKLGVVFDRAALKTAEEFIDSLTRMKAALRGAVGALAVELFPVLSDFLNRMAFSIAENRDAWSNFGARAAEALFVTGGAIKAFLKLIADLATDTTSVEVFGDVLAKLANTALKIAAETIIALVKIAKSAFDVIFRPLVDVASLVGEQIGARITAGMAGPFFELPARLAKSVDAGFDFLRDKVGDTVFGAIQAGLAIQAPGISAMMGASLVLDEDTIDKATKENIAKWAKLSEERILEAETILATAVQGTIQVIGEEVATSGEAVATAVKNAKGHITDLLASLEGLRDNPAVNEFLTTIENLPAALDALRARMRATGEEEAPGPPTVPTLSAEALERSAFLIRESQIAMMRGEEALTAAIHLEHDKRLASLQQMLVDGQISIEAFNAASLAAEHERTQGLLEINGTFLDGAREGLKVFAEEMPNAFEAGSAAIQEVLTVTIDEFGTAIGNIISGTQDAGEAFEAMGKAVLQTIGKIVAELIALAVVRAIFGGSPIGFAEGGVTRGPIRGLQHGGVISEPTLALIGEGRHREAVVPLPDGRTIPATITDPAPVEPAPQVTFEIRAMDGADVERTLASPRAQAVIERVILRAMETKRSFRQTIAVVGGR